MLFDAASSPKSVPTGLFVRSRRTSYRDGSGNRPWADNKRTGEPFEGSAPSPAVAKGIPATYTPRLGKRSVPQHLDATNQPHAVR